MILIEWNFSSAKHTAIEAIANCDVIILLLSASVRFFHKQGVKTNPEWAIDCIMMLSMCISRLAYEQWAQSAVQGGARCSCWLLPAGAELPSAERSLCYGHTHTARVQQRNPRPVMQELRVVTLLGLQKKEEQSTLSVQRQLPAPPNFLRNVFSSWFAGFLSPFT